MKDYIKKHKATFIILSLLLFFLLILPFIVNFNSKESSTDYVNYYGMLLTSIFSSIVTIIIFYFTLNENRKQLDKERDFTKKLSKEDRRLNVKPFIVTNVKFINKMRIKENNYIIIGINKNQINEFISDFPQNKNIIESFLTPDLHKYIYNNATNYIILEYIIENYGANNAINLDFSINNENINLQAIKTTDKIQYILLINKDIFNNKEITYKFIYTDITTETIYKQEQTVKFIINDINSDNVILKITPLSKP